MPSPSEQSVSFVPGSQQGDQISAQVGNDARNIAVGKDIQQYNIEHVEQIVIQQPLVTSSSRIPIPNLLICKVDREMQERDLVRAISNLAPDLSYPVLCIIHGGEHEAHDSFVKRLSHDYLPKQMRLSFVPGVKPFPLPSDLENVGLLADEIKRKLSEKICGDWHSPLDIINAKLNRDGTYVLYTVLYHEDLSKLGFEVVEEFIRFWQSWPVLTTGQILFVCLCIRYRLENTKPAKSGFFSRFLRRDVAVVPIHETLEKSLKTLDFSQFKRLMGIPLPRLEPVEHRHVEKWTDREETQTYLEDSGMAAHTILEEMQEIYDAQGSDENPVRIPMDMVEDNLRRILDKYR